MRHHTKDKGDEGLGFIIADLMSSGIQVALPISEHLPFDCIAISEKGKLLRLSVKYRAINKAGFLELTLRSSWADRHGVHIRKHNKIDYDAIAVYCPNTKLCYYILITEIDNQTFDLRILEPKKGGKQKTIHWAKDYINAQRLFSSPSSSKGRATAL